MYHGTPEDNYNFFQSSSRISVECAFGEIGLQWGILWKPLRFSLVHNVDVIDACMRLHNFIVDYREMAGEADLIDEIERAVFNEDCRRLMAVNTNYPGGGGVHGGEADARLDSQCSHWG